MEREGEVAVVVAVEVEDDWKMSRQHQTPDGATTKH